MRLYQGKHRTTAARLAETRTRRAASAQERRVVELLATGQRADWVLVQR